MSAIIDRIRKSGNWSSETSDEVVWNETVQYYQTQARHERRKVIDTVQEEHLPDGMSVNQETADALRRLRELEIIDLKLWKAGR